MTFYVEKSLAHGPIRFGVSPRLNREDVDRDASLSTGRAGEFLRRRTHGFFFADNRPIDAPALPVTRTISSVPFLSSLRPRDARGWGFLGLMLLGVIFVFLGFAVIIVKLQWQGWIEVVLGLAMIAAPIMLTAKERRDIRIKEEQERAEREERERRHREMLASYVAALERLRREPNAEALAAAAREREKLELPYEIWAGLARRTVLQIGFEALERDPADLMDRVAAAVGLTEEDRTAVRRDFYRVLAWHLLADDRLGPPQTALLARYREQLGIAERDVPLETEAIKEFELLRGIDRDNLPRRNVGVPLKFREYGIHAAGPLHLTNKHVIVEGRKRLDIPLSQVDDVVVNADANTLTIRVAPPAKPVVLQVEQPFYTAALIDLATNLDERPRSFA